MFLYVKKKKSFFKKIQHYFKFLIAKFLKNNHICIIYHTKKSQNLVFFIFYFACIFDLITILLNLQGFGKNFKQTPQKSICLINI